MKKILHVLSLQNIGGTETTFCDFIRSPLSLSKATHSVYALGNKVHPDLQSLLYNTTAAVFISRAMYNINIPLFLSNIKYRALLKKMSPNLIVFWNCLGSINSKHQWLYNLDIPYIHFERGNIESCTFNPYQHEFLVNSQLILANSLSNARHIELRYNPGNHIKTCYTGLPRNFGNFDIAPKRYPLHRSFRIGFCGRLSSIKGIAVAVQALEKLKKNSKSITLHIAGTGPEKQNLYSLSSKLGVADQVFFHGLINFEKIVQFYNYIDLLIIPSIRESFAKVSLEAQYSGCPVIVSKVDGLPETIVEGQTGYSILPTLDIYEYIKMGGSADGLPELVYSPDEDELVLPKAISPEHLAEKIMFIMQNPKLYEKLSINAHNNAKERFNHENHVKKIWRLFTNEMQNK